jgi:hypothetical protein
MAIRLAKWVVPGAVLLSAGFWAGKSLPATTVTPQVMAGTVVQVRANDAFVFRQGGDGQPTGYGLSESMQWRNAYGVWQDGSRPACMRPLTRGQRITIGVINAAPVADAPGGSVVVWLECPGKPISRYPIVTPSAATSP